MRVPLHGRRVAGWVVALDVDPPPGVRLQPIARVTGRGPAPDVVSLTQWGAWRWAGRRTAFLRAASPGVAVPTGTTPAAAVERRVVEDDLAREALAAVQAVVRLPPAADPVPLLRAMCAAGPLLIACADVGMSYDVARRVPGAVAAPAGWARAAGGGTTYVGGRSAVWGPCPSPGAVVVLDAHDRVLVEERAPTWSAWVVAAERAARGGVPCVLVSPCPTVDQLRWGSLLLPSRRDERDGWARVEVLDRSEQDPRAGLLSERLVPIVRAATPEHRVICVLNRTGRVRLMACRACRATTLCEHCGGPMQLLEEELQCQRCLRARPAVCQVCGSTALRVARAGVSKVRDELEVLARMPVEEVTAASAGDGAGPLVIGTEAALRRNTTDVGTVVFLDFDNELSAPRYRANEEALALVARASRIAGRVVVQTRQPRHVVLRAAVRADPSVLSEEEMALRAALELPPYVALAEVTGDAAPWALERLAAQLGISVSGSIVRAPDHRTLCDALAAVGRPPGVGNARLRIDVDPARI